MSMIDKAIANLTPVAQEFIGDGEKVEFAYVGFGAHPMILMGGLLGALILIRVKAGFVRYLLIGIMFFTSFGLFTKGLQILGFIGEIPMWVNGGLFVVIMILVVRGIFKSQKSA